METQQNMDAEQMTATKVIDATPAALFAELANPASHAAIDGTGWVREALDTAPLTRTGQIFRMAMYHENHPDKNYEIANRVEIADGPNTIAWQPGQESAETGEVELGGWTWRYDIEPVGPTETKVILTYDWSAVPAETREEIEFPPFGPDHLTNSLQHLGDLVTPARP